MFTQNIKIAGKYTPSFTFLTTFYYNLPPSMVKVNSWGLYLKIYDSRFLVEYLPLQFSGNSGIFATLSANSG